MGDRKIFSIIICGQSGIGKTEFAKIVSEKMFPQEELIKINFGNYSTEGVLNSLIGSPLGYVGSEEGGELINKIKKSKSKVILIDEFEKATPSVYNFFYELLEDGIFTDRHGEKHDLNGYIENPLEIKNDFIFEDMCDLYEQSLYTCEGIFEPSIVLLYKAEEKLRNYIIDMVENIDFKYNEELLQILMRFVESSIEYDMRGAIFGFCVFEENYIDFFNRTAYNISEQRNLLDLSALLL